MRPSDFDSIEQRNAIYFPFINVPESTEFIQTLLYWDKIYSIVPMNCRENGILNRSMEAYLDADLVSPLLPRDYVFEIPEDILQKLVKHLNRLKSLIQSRASRSDMEPVAIHREKLEVVLGPLLDSEIIQRTQTEWYLMPKWAAYRFMTVLATALGRMPQFLSAPITDELDCYQFLRGSRMSGGPSTRDMILKNILPIPATRMDIDELKAFKRQYRAQLKRFRRRIETEAIRCNTISDRQEQSRAMTMALAQLHDEKEQLSEELDVPLNFASVSTLLAAAAAMITTEPVGLIAGGLGLVAGIAQIRDARGKCLANPLAYAALAERKFSVP